MFFQMRIRFLLLLTFLLSFLSFSQNKKLNNDEIYSIIKVVIKRDKLKKSFGLAKKPLERYTTMDESFLKEYLKINNKNNEDKNNDTEIITNISFPNKELLDEHEIIEMLDSKNNFKNFEWNNSHLKFSRNNKKYYQFSIPLFNKDRTKVIIQYNYNCPGLCGHGKTLFMNKIDNDWKITFLNFWMH